MAQGKQQLKCERSQHMYYRENWDTDGRRRTDERTKDGFDLMSSADSQAELKVTGQKVTAGMSQKEKKRTVPCKVLWW